MSSIGQAIDQLVLLQKALTITSPVSVGIKRTYKVPPPRAQALEPHCFLNTWTLTSLNRKTTSLLEQRYAIHSQLFVDDADLNRAAEIAMAFHAAYVKALNQNIALGGSVGTSELRGGDPTLALLEWAGKSYAGLDLYLDVVLTEGMTFS